MTLAGSAGAREGRRRRCWGTVLELKRCPRTPPRQRTSEREGVERGPWLGWSTSDGAVACPSHCEEVSARLPCAPA